MTITALALAFSNGEFEKTYDYISETAEWTIVEEDKFFGKQAIVANCESVAHYFKSVKTEFKTWNVISAENKVVINGTAEMKRENKQVAFVSACDVYEFNDKFQIQRITSYCIQSKSIQKS